MKTLKEEVFEIVGQMPNLTAGEIRQLTSKPTGNSVYSILSNLKSVGIVSVASGRYTLLPGAELGKVRTPTRRKSVVQTPAGEAETCRLLREEVRELLAWKEAAIARFPDLAVDPLVLKARQIVSTTFLAQGDAEQAKNANLGKLDGRPIMIATLAALES